MCKLRDTVRGAQTILYLFGFAATTTWSDPGESTTRPAGQVAAATSTAIEGQDFTVPGVGMAFVWIDALKSWVGKYEVTNGEYRRFNADHRSRPYEERLLDGDRQPVVYVTHVNAIAFADWMTAQAKAAGGLPEGAMFRLLTGDEWTAIAACGDERKYPWGNEWPPTFGNYDTDTEFDNYTIEGYTDNSVVSCNVEDSGRNPWGLFGVGGNALEWTTEKNEHEIVVRGGSWYHFNRYTLECTFRSSYHPEIRFESLGMRLILAR